MKKISVKSKNEDLDDLFKFLVSLLNAQNKVLANIIDALLDELRKEFRQLAKSIRTRNSCGCGIVRTGIRKKHLNHRRV